MKVIVTRPAAQADEWVTLLAGRGIEGVALPLIEIAAAQDGAAVQAAWRTLARHRLVVFVSPNAAQQFFAQQPDAVNWPPATRAASPGPGTTAVLRRLGVPAGAIVEPAADAPQFDSESLWRELSRDDWHGASVLIARGESGRDWLAETLRASGAKVEFVTAYSRRAPRLDDTALALLEAAQSEPQAHLWLFSSSESIDHLHALAPQARWAEAIALTTHPRIAQRAREAGFGRVHECAAAAEAVVRCIQSIGSPDATPSRP